MANSQAMKVSGVRASEMEKLAAGLVASPEFSLAASATAAALGEFMQQTADDQLVMTGDALRQIDASADQRYPADVAEDATAVAIQNYVDSYSAAAAGEPLLLAQARGNSDAGGGLVSDEDSPVDEGGLGYGWALGALALGLALGGGKDGDSVEYYDAGGLPGYMVKYTGSYSDSGTTFVVSTAGGNNADGYKISSLPATSNPNLNLSLWTYESVEVPGGGLTATGDALPSKYQLLAGSYNPSTGSFTTGVGDDVLVIWDSGKVSGKDYAIALLDFGSSSDNDFVINSKTWVVTVSSGSITTIA